MGNSSHFKDWVQTTASWPLFLHEAATDVTLPTGKKRYAVIDVYPEWKDQNGSLRMPNELPSWPPD